MKTSKRTIQRRHREEVQSTLNYVRYGRAVVEQVDQARSTAHISNEDISTSVNDSVSNIVSQISLGHKYNSVDFRESTNYVEGTAINNQDTLRGPTVPSEHLRIWAIKHNLSHDALRELLLLLRNYNNFQDLPKDPRTLLKTPSNAKLSIINISGGS